MIILIWLPLITTMITGIWIIIRLRVGTKYKTFDYVAAGLFAISAMISFVFIMPAVVNAL